MLLLFSGQPSSLFGSPDNTAGYSAPISQLVFPNGTLEPVAMVVQLYLALPRLTLPPWADLASLPELVSI